MPKIAVLSDIHANFAALEAVLKDCRSQDVEAYWCLGDILGYGPFPMRTLYEMHSLAQNSPHTIILMGNHDYMVCNYGTKRFDAFQNARFPLNAEAIKMIKMHHEALKRQNELMEWLHNRPLLAQPLPGFLLAHGFYSRNGFEILGRYAENEIVVNTQIERAVASGITPRALLLGHRHLTFFMQKQPHISSWKEIEKWEQTTSFTFEELEKLPIYINPGSIGWPRGAETCPSWVLLDINPKMGTISVSFRHVYYNWEKLVAPDGPMGDAYPFQPIRNAARKCRPQEG